MRSRGPWGKKARLLTRRRPPCLAPGQKSSSTSIDYLVKQSDEGRTLHVHSIPGAAADLSLPADRPLPHKEHEMHPVSPRWLPLATLAAVAFLSGPARAADVPHVGTWKVIAYRGP